MTTSPDPTTDTTDTTDRPAPRRRRFLVGTAAASLAVAGLAGLAGTASASDAEPPVDDLPAATGVDADEVEAPEDHLVVFSADVRVDGHRVDEEWLFAFGYDDEYPFFSSLWLLVDHDPVTDTDDWAPICFGYTIGDDEGAIFVGGSEIGDEDDGCVLATLGDDQAVVFGAVELEGDAALTAAMYPIG